ncbi:MULTISPECIES: flagellar basal body rod protein FlgC [Methylobacterium]|jgi:flagellar basal-body rod protein FlgC|uniref:Flagellar basal-body rod protein FlgC n=2 Tax=Methylobacterium TaxID=407 RepID=A0A0C6F8B1_9HYPH|nr:MULTISPECIES: flagellar basal body rod protein FlgC [Methylobacterium]MBK3396166.1 flagellar basal body rod protein FlgC [Methylobacterium ajmalii]MBK3406792.1 flagellar basal body rod protein FlgC [Methylobacterium ajmalii]MBK3425625.1 flagellar basal body rod protein FlgC [Methylobacterium ajmalii]MBZ6415292.1 flagellar basal body rod protein FlgC [Methylobacterium sp.]SEO95226.1 flagellar basal-body rod protein FlgC [Methylobacterium sp. ap11]
MDFSKALGIAASGLKVQSGRMRVISENIANADSAPTSPTAEPYRRKIATFNNHLDRELDASVVDLGKIRRDQSPFRTKQDPGNPAADANGEVRMPNVNVLVETVDMREAQRSYEANLNMVSLTNRMVSRTIDILKA